MDSKRVIRMSVAVAVVALASVLVWVLVDGDEPVASECSQVQTTSSDGALIPEVMLAEVRAVHDAACRGDYTVLVAHAETDFVGTPLVALKEDGGAPMKVLAETLETAGQIGQGGLRYCHPRAGIAYFPRGTLTIAGKWSGFSLTARCEEERPG